jgi:hypothetical protein
VRSDIFSFDVDGNRNRLFQTQWFLDQHYSPTLTVVLYVGFCLIQQVLLKKSSDSSTLCVTKDSNGETPFHKTAKGGYLKCLKFLAAQVPDQVSSLDNSGMTPAAHAAKVQYAVVCCWKVRLCLQYAGLSNREILQDCFI